MDDFNDLTFTKFSVGQSVSRFEDPELLRGEGTYTDDIKSESQTLEAFVFRSPYAHGKIDHAKNLIDNCEISGIALADALHYKRYKLLEIKKSLLI